MERAKEHQDDGGIDGDGHDSYNIDNSVHIQSDPPTTNNTGPHVGGAINSNCINSMQCRKSGDGGGGEEVKNTR